MNNNNFCVRPSRVSSDVLVDEGGPVVCRLQLQLDRALEPEAQQLLRVADQEVRFVRVLEQRKQNRTKRRKAHSSLGAV